MIGGLGGSLFFGLFSYCSTASKIPRILEGGGPIFIGIEFDYVGGYVMQCLASLLLCVWDVTYYQFFICVLWVDGFFCIGGVV